MIRLFSTLQISQSYTPGNNAELLLGENHGYLLGAFGVRDPLAVITMEMVVRDVRFTDSKQA